MRHAALIAFACLALAAAPARAQSEYTVPAVETAPVATGVASPDDTRVPEGQRGVQGQMPAVPDDGYGPAPLDGNLLNAYYDRCMKNVYLNLSDATRDEFCSCTTAQMKDALTPDEIKVLATGKGTLVDNAKLATEVVSLCLAGPIEETEFDKCMHETQYAHYFKSQNAYDSTCQCIIGGITRFVESYGHDLMAATVAMNPTTADNPMTALTTTWEYRKEVARLRTSCLNSYVNQ